MAVRQIEAAARGVINCAKIHDAALTEYLG